MATQTETGYASLADFIDANGRAGHHFFDRDTARFFRSRWDDGRMYGGRFFITSEQFEGSNGRRAARAYTVRIANLDGTVGGDVGEFQAYATLAQARKAANDAAAGYAEGLTVSTVEGTAYNEAYRAGWNLRRFEGANAPDKYGNTRADYLRSDVLRLERQIEERRAEIAALESTI